MDNALELPTRISWRRGDAPDLLLSREWLIANGIGGYASGTLAGVCTRRFHSLLVAAQPVPLGRLTYVSHLTEKLAVSDDAPWVQLSGDDDADRAPVFPDANWLAEVRVEAGLPVWSFEHDGITLEKRIVVPHRQNTTYVTYSLLRAPRAVRLSLTPEFQVRRHEGRVDEAPLAYPLNISGEQYEIAVPGLPPLRMFVVSKTHRLVLHESETRVRRYLYEEERGYDARGPLSSSAAFEVTLTEGDSASFCVSTEDWERIFALSPESALQTEIERRRRLVLQAHPKARQGIGAELVLAADQFIIQPQTRSADSARALAAGDDARTIIAGYHWFTDWGRDTMISLDGLALVTGRHAEAGYILRTFARYVRDGLIPNLFPEGESKGLYHTADASLWFFHAVERHLRATNDREMVRALLPTMIDIIDHHVKGTHFGIVVDPNDGLLHQGAAGYQLTWMDAKVDGWVVTPRRGKAVEINALFYNAVKLLAGWIREERGAEAAVRYEALAERARVSFNRRFWIEARGYLYDVVDGDISNGKPKDDPSLRPNQVFAISLDHPILDPARWDSVLRVVRDKLWTPVGLRSLAPGEPDYKACYDGDLRSRDAAYHQGTVWGWLIGPFIDAWRRAYPDDAESPANFLRGFTPHLSEACIGSVSEIFDAETPFTPRGCIAQAWSVAEVLRSIAREP